MVCFLLSEYQRLLEMFYFLFAVAKLYYMKNAIGKHKMQEHYEYLSHSFLIGIYVLYICMVFTMINNN
jgi:uncharacterized membrane protein